MEIVLQSKSTIFAMQRKQNKQVQRALREHIFGCKRNCTEGKTHMSSNGALTKVPIIFFSPSGATADHSIIESWRLEKTSKIIKSNHQPNTTMPAKPSHVLHLHLLTQPVWPRPQGHPRSGLLSTPTRIFFKRHLTYRHTVTHPTAIHQWKGKTMPHPQLPTPLSPASWRHGPPAQSHTATAGLGPLLPPHHRVPRQTRERSSKGNKSRLSSSVTTLHMLPLLHLRVKALYLSPQKLFSSPVLGTGKCSNTNFSESKPL